MRTQVTFLNGPLAGQQRHIARDVGRITVPMAPSASLATYHGDTSPRRLEWEEAVYLLSNDDQGRAYAMQFPPSDIVWSLRVDRGTLYVRGTARVRGNPIGVEHAHPVDTYVPTTEYLGFVLRDLSSRLAGAAGAAYLNLDRRSL